MTICLKQMIIGIAMTCLMAVVLPIQGITVFAANAKISFSDPLSVVGNEVVVTVKISSAGTTLSGADLMLSYDSAALEFVSGTNASGGAGAIRLQETVETADTKALNFSLKFKALQSGSTQIKVTSQEIYDIDSQAVAVNKTGSSTVTIKPLSTYAKNADLKSLKVSPGTLVPAFSSAVDTYSMEVGGDVSKIAVSVECADEKAQVVISGHSDLVVGENTVVCKVTAEDGETVKSYTIKVNKTAVGETALEGAAAPIGDLKVMIDNMEYGIAASFDETILPEGFEATTYSYKGNKISAGRGLEKELTLLYLSASDGTGGFYIYNEAADSWSPYLEIKTSAKSIVILPIDESAEIPDGYVTGTMDLEGRQAQGWVWSADQDPQYWLFYGMNWKGEKNLYRYDLAENTIQRYLEDPVADDGITQEMFVKVAQDYNDLLIDYNLRFKIIIVLIAASVVLAAVLTYLLLKKDKHHSSNGDAALNDKNSHDITSHEDRHMSGKDGEGESMRLNDKNSEGIDLEEIALEEVDLEEVDLEEVDLEEVDLEEVGLEEVDLEEVGLEEVDLEEVGLEEVDLEEVDLEEVDLEEIDLEGNKS